jgi:two-component system sensor histidine kinase ArlS
MNLKQRFSFIFSCLFSAVLAIVMLTVYYLFANLRESELIGELTEKAQTTAKILIQVNEVNYAMQRIIDSNTVNKLYNEKTQIYNGARKLIYSSASKPGINWTNQEFDKVKKDKSVLKKNAPFVVLGIYDIVEKNGYYILISVDDTYYNNGLRNIQYILFFAFITGTAMVWLLSFGLGKKALEPLDNFRRKIQEINDSNLKVRLYKEEREDEINALANSFNQMMDRINNAYDRQREFTSNASHELRTPIARIAAQLENLSHRDELDETVRVNLKSIFQDTFQLSDVVSSLVALADINSREHRLSFQKIRLDEIVYTSTAELAKIYPDFKLKFEIENNTAKETDLEITGDETLLKIVFLNLFKNAYMYSDNRQPECLISQDEGRVTLYVTNTGEPPDVPDTASLFTAFYRGNNSTSIEGSGIGLSIVKRIIDYHNAEVNYQIIDNRTNQVSVIFMR